ncbi:MAG: hypothetical protein U0794_08890 [Isosphaeraceae bacterium]
MSQQARGDRQAISSEERTGSRVVVTGAAGACFAAAFLVAFAPLVFQDRQFGVRDAAHFYYPLYLRVQQEWNAGRWPLWLPEMNGGMPLLGNPTAAVFYPGKLLYAVLPYAWAARTYPLAHVGLAFAGMVVLLRRWGVSVAGAAIGGLAYAFSGPVLFQCANVVYLVGAAWLPLGLVAAGVGRRREADRSVLGFALVLSMLLLGGDWETGYLLAVIALADSTLPGGASLGSRRIALLLGVLTLIYIAHLILAFRGDASVVALWALSASGWGLVFAFMGVRGRADSTPPASFRDPSIAPRSRRWLRPFRRTRNADDPAQVEVMRSASIVRGRASVRLVGAIAVAAGLAAVQLGPGLEFAWTSDRASSELADAYRFSLRPIELGGWVWPNVCGSFDQGNRGWPAAFRADPADPFWVPSTYAGLLTMVLALGMVASHETRPGRAWALVFAGLGVLCALGGGGGWLAWARWLGVMPGTLGVADPIGLEGSRPDGRPRDFVGSAYWFLTVAFPGFASFRYPAKLLTLASLGLTGLAGMGWDRVQSGQTRRPAQVALGLVLISGLMLALFALGGTWFHGLLSSRAAMTASYLGSLDVPGAMIDIGLALSTGMVGGVLILVVLRVSAARSSLGACCALGFLTLDLLLANTRLVGTIPQSVFETTPRLVAAIEEAESRERAAGPFRVERLAIRYPGVHRPGREGRWAEVARWERETLLFQHPIAFGIASTYVSTSLHDREQSLAFAPTVSRADENISRDGGLRVGEPIVDHPRTSYDLWNTRYFILPDRPAPGDALRGLGAFFGATHDVGAAKGLEADDIRLVRNERAFPRAWVVHQTEPLPPRAEDTAAARLARRDALTGGGDVDTPTHSPDLRKVAFVETEEHLEMGRRLGRPARADQESVEVEVMEPQRVELRVHLEAPGLVVLADSHAPGWKLTVDGRPAPIVPTNLAMRGAVVGQGTHRLVYLYAPASFRVGAAVSAISWIGLLVGIGIRRVRRFRAASLRSQSS